MASVREHNRLRLSAMGITLVNYRDPVDGSEVPVIDEDQFATLLAWIDAQLLEAVQARPIRVEVSAVADVRNLVNLAIEQERDAIIADVLAAAPPLNAELSYDGSEEPGMAAYVEAWHSMWAIVNARKVAKR